MLCDPVPPTSCLFSDLTSVLSLASRARLLKQPWPTVLWVEDLSLFKQQKLLSTPADAAPIIVQLHVFKEHQEIPQLSPVPLQS